MSAAGIFWLGVASILSGWAYTGGPLPIAYTPMGEVFVMAFFGVGAVGGTYWLCAGALPAVAIEAGLAVGLFTGAVLLVNNHRDGRRASRPAHACDHHRARRNDLDLRAALMLTPFVLMLPVAQVVPRGHVWPTLLALPLAGLLIYKFVHEPRGRGFNKILVQTVLVQLLFSVLLAVGLLT